MAKSLFSPSRWWDTACNLEGTKIDVYKMLIDDNLLTTICWRNIDKTIYTPSFVVVGHLIPWNLFSQFLMRLLYWTIEQNNQKIESYII